MNKQTNKKCEIISNGDKLPTIFLESGVYSIKELQDIIDEADNLYWEEMHKDDDYDLDYEV